MKELSLQQANKLSVVGIGYRPLGKRAKERVCGSSVILASSRLFEVFQRYDEYEEVKDRIKVINKVPETIAFIKDWLSQSVLPTPHSELRTIVLLASGDPLFFGIGRRMREEFGKEAVEILPDLSSAQEAFARINEPWDDAVFISLHGGPDIAKRRALPYEVRDIPRLLEQTGKMGILTDRVNNPAIIASTLQSAAKNRQPGIIMHVCEHLGYPDEKIVSGTVEELANRSFADPNVVILLGSEAGKRKPEVRFGLQEDDIVHERGLITKDEVRAVTLHRLRLPEKGVFWDVGAGSGSVSLEAARLCPGLRIIAIEKDLKRIDAIQENKRRFFADNIELVDKAAPGALADLPAPDRVFIGGSGGSLGDIVKLISSNMTSGIVVINAATLETLQEAMASLEGRGFTVDVSEISVSRSKVIAGKRLMSALNPVFIVKGERGQHGG
jgi:precorrin-6Y C5,15-methyltransferase (decarboxylating)